MENNTVNGSRPYLSSLGAWALAFGCSVGWGSFVMPGTTFLPNAGPLGTVIGILLGGAVMFIIAGNYHYLINKYPDGGGAYTYTKKCFGYDHGFLSAWFMILTYIAVIWANATALPLIMRTLFGSTFQFGFHYQIAGFDVYMGEIILVIVSMLIGALVCLRRSLASRTQTVMAVLLFAGVVICFAGAAAKNGSSLSEQPMFSEKHSTFGGMFTIFALAPWAFVGFESISHSAGEAKFPLKRSFRIMGAALVMGALAYSLLALLGASAQPEGFADWQEYTEGMGRLSGISSQPTFFAAENALGTAGSVILGTAAVCAIFTGIIGNYIALSRLIRTMSEDGLIPGRIGKLDKNSVPRNALRLIFGISFVLPFFGRTAISWIVDVTTVGGTIAFAFTSASALRPARKSGEKWAAVTGVVGLAVSLLFALEFLIPNLLSVQTLSTESYLILAAWGILGFAVFYCLLKKDTQRHFGRSTVAWIVLLGLIVFTSTVWMKQSTSEAIAKAAEQNGETVLSLDGVEKSISAAMVIQIGLIITALIILFVSYSKIHKREKQIEVEKALAEDASRAKTSFLSNMSHEIRTPMNAIIGLDNIALRDPELSPRTREQLEKIGASARHLLGLINDILDMSRIESGRMVLKSEEFLFRDLMDQINIIINGQCVDKGLKYECRIVGHPEDYYLGDDMKLKQVLINILGNSVKFTEAPGSVSLTVEQAAEDGDERTLRFVMSDTGIGMDKEYIPKIFEAFSQEDATTTNRYGGSGLGMAITKNFVEMMGGSIGVTSEKGVGSVFTVTVRLKATGRTYQPEQGARLPEGLRALAVDDDDIACEHVQVVLESLGVETETEFFPETALERLRKAFEEGHPYQLLLTDYKMPGTDGLEFTRSVREFDGGTTAVVMLTGCNWDIVDDEARECGVDEIIAKPLFTDSLYKAIYSALEKRKGVSGAETGAEIPAEAPAGENFLAGRRILMAEDMDANAEILADLLELEDILSERAENGQAAVDMFNEKPAGYYDAVLMDVRMPVMDGLAATAAIRAFERPDAKTIPIIAMTANVFDEDVERSLEAGMNAHLSKPIEPDKLYETMTELIRKAEAGA